MPRAVTGKDFGFTLTSATVDGKPHAVARFFCADCGAMHDVRVKAGEALAPQAYASHMKTVGWEADAVRAQRVLCPECKAHKAPNDTDSELKKLEAKMKTTAVPAPAASPPVVALRELTADQRAKVRELIEKHFDEDEGCYLDEFSDEQIAESVNVPRVLVERVREGGYGPIRVSAAQVELKRELRALHAKLDTVQSEAKSLHDQLTADLASLRGEVEKLLAKGAKAA